MEMPKEFEFLDEEAREKYAVKIDYVIIRCTNPKCNWHWGISLANRATQKLTPRDLICQHCAADKYAEEIE